MNRDEGSYQLSHIYDNLFAATSSGGDRELVRSEEGNSCCRNVNNNKLKVVF